MPAVTFTLKVAMGKCSKIMSLSVDWESNVKTFSFSSFVILDCIFNRGYMIVLVQAILTLSKYISNSG